MVVEYQAEARRRRSEESYLRSHINRGNHVKSRPSLMTYEISGLFVRWGDYDRLETTPTLSADHSSLTSALSAAVLRRLT
jgi:hypothetical protein